MTNEAFNQIREKDHTVLACIRGGVDDVQQIKATTTLSKNEVNYSFSKLAEHGFIDVSRPEGTVERVIDGQKRVFDAPKVAVLTRKAAAYFEWTDRTETIDTYREMSRAELIERVYELEQRVDELQQAFETFRRQVQDHL
jgi:hypothetical protein